KHGVIVPLNRQHRGGKRSCDAAAELKAPAGETQQTIAALQLCASLSRLLGDRSC
ncbi:hypothetical protein ATANTOWER_000398, partial [Ataeniobius toweri]|nr:hypothetical protein [Ataeniobius toweri]